MAMSREVMRIGWLAAEHGIPVSLGNSFLEIGVNMAIALPEVEWLEYSFQNFDHLVEQPFEIRDGYPMRRSGPAMAWCCRRRRAAIRPCRRCWRMRSAAGAAQHAPAALRIRAAAALAGRGCPERICEGGMTHDMQLTNRSSRRHDARRRLP